MNDKIKKIFTFIGFTVVVIASILIAIDFGGEGILATSLPAIFAICFIFSNNATLKNFGYAISAVNLAVGVAGIQSDDMMILGVGLIIMALASVLYFIELVFAFFGYVLNKSKGGNCSANCTDDFAEVEKYSQMLAEGVITESEYASLKAKIFAVKKDKANSIEDLKKWKKLYDKKLISEEEYSSIKTKILK